MKIKSVSILILTMNNFLWEYKGLFFDGHK